MRPTMKKKLNFEAIASHFFAMNFKGTITWDIDKEGWMLLAHQGGLSEYTTTLQHLDKILVREDTLMEETKTEAYRKTETGRIPVYSYVCVVSAHVIIDGVPGARTINLRSDTVRRKRPIGQDNLVSIADTSATKAAIKFALGITKSDVQQIAKDLKLDSTKTTMVDIPEDVKRDEDVTSTLSEEEIKKAEEALWS